VIGRKVTALVFQRRDGKVRLGDAGRAARLPREVGAVLIVRPDV
jgi:hypothetical protein